MRTLKGPKDPEVGAILAEMSNIKVWLDDLDGAERRRALQLRSIRQCRTDYPDRVMAEYYLADMLLIAAKLTKQHTIRARACRTASALRRQESRSRGNAGLARSGAHCAEEVRRGGEADPRSTRGASRIVEYRHPEIGYLQTMLATVQMRQRRFAEAEQILRETLVLLSQERTRGSPVHRFRGALPRRSAARAAQVSRSRARTARGDRAMEAHGRAGVALRALTRTRWAKRWMGRGESTRLSSTSWTAIAS